MTNRASSAGSGYAGGGSIVPTIRPDPDPTILTTQQLLREIANMKELIVGRIESIERSIEVSHDDLVRVPTHVDKAIESLRSLVWGRFDQEDERITGMEKVNNERFTSIGTQFKERDTRVEQTARDSKVAIDAALAAQEKSASKQTDSLVLSIDKSEKTTIKSIDALQQLLTNTSAGLAGNINDLKDRIAKLEGTGQRIEGQGTGQHVAKVEHQTSNAALVSIAAVITSTVIGIIYIIVSLIGHVAVK